MDFADISDRDGVSDENHHAYGRATVVGRTIPLILCCAVCLSVLSVQAAQEDGFAIRVSDLDDAGEVSEETILWDLNEVFRPATFQDQPALAIPRARPAATETPAAAEELRAAFLGAERDQPESAATEAPAQAVGVGADFVLGLEAKTRNATDAGNLMGKSPASLGLGVQQR